MKTFLLNFYRRQFAQSIFVLKLSGKLADPTLFATIADDIAELREAGVQVVLVHGGGVQIDQQLTALGHPIRKVKGRRVTDGPTLAVVQQVIGGSVNQSFVTGLQRSGVTAVGLTGLDAHTVRVTRRPTTPDGTDYGFVGDITSVDPSLIQTLLKAGHVPVVGCLGVDPDGQAYNVNADTVATEIAIALQAQKLVFFTDTNGILDADGQRLSVIVTDQLAGLVADGTIRGGMQVKAHNAERAALSTVDRVHIIQGADSHTLHDEIFSLEGVGTMIVSPTEAATYRAENQ